MEFKVILSSFLHSRPGQGTGRCCLRTATKSIFKWLCTSDTRCEDSDCPERGNLVFLLRYCICIEWNGWFWLPWTVITKHHEAPSPTLPDSDCVQSWLPGAQKSQPEEALWPFYLISHGFAFQGAREVLGALGGVKLWIEGRARLEFGQRWRPGKAQGRVEDSRGWGNNNRENLCFSGWKHAQLYSLGPQICQAVAEFSFWRNCPWYPDRASAVIPDIYFLEQKPEALLPQNGTSLTSWDSSHFQRKL